MGTTFLLPVLLIRCYSRHYFSAALSVCTHNARVISSHLDNSIRVWSLPAAAVEVNAEGAVGQRSDYHQVTAIAVAGERLLSGQCVCRLRHSQHGSNSIMACLVLLVFVRSNLCQFFDYFMFRLIRLSLVCYLIAWFLIFTPFKP